MISFALCILATDCPMSISHVPSTASTPKVQSPKAVTAYGSVRVSPRVVFWDGRWWQDSSHQPFGAWLVSCL